MHLPQFTAGALLALAASLGLGSSAPAQDSYAAPTYTRLRTGADDWHARGGFRYGFGGYGHGYGYFQPYISPVIAGSWYTRPYPYHLDYFRSRWGGLPGEPAADCPCATPGTEGAAESSIESNALPPAEL